MKMLATAVRYVRDNDAAEDIVQDALLRLWQMHPRLNLPIGPIAMVLTRNLAIDYLRRQHPHEPVELLPLTDESIDEAGQERIRHVLAIVSALPTLQQTIIRLRHIEGMEFRDIALLTGSSEAAVRQALSRARREVLKRYNNEERRSKKAHQ